MDKIINNSELSIPRPDQSAETMTEEVILPVWCVRAKTWPESPKRICWLKFIRSRKFSLDSSVEVILTLLSRFLNWDLIVDLSLSKRLTVGDAILSPMRFNILPFTVAALRMRKSSRALKQIPVFGVIPLSVCVISTPRNNLISCSSCDHHHQQ